MLAKKSLILSFSVFLFFAIIFSCGEKKEEESSKKLEERKTSELKSVSVRMKWFFAGTMSGWFTGKEKDLFRKNGIDISIRPGGPQNNSVKLVAAKSDDFGVTGADELLLARAKGIPIKAVAVLFKHSPVCFISKKEKQINTPKDWVGRKIEVSYGENAEYQFRALLNKFNLKKDDFIEVPYTYSVIPFVEGKVDVSPAYSMDQATTIEKQGINLNKIFARDYGIDPYGDIIITREEIIEEDPQLVKSFLAAVFESHEWARKHPEEAVNVLIENASNLKYDDQLEVFKGTIPFIYPDGEELPPGYMSLKRWQESYDVLRQFDVIKAEIDLQGCFTNDFLPSKSD